MSSYASGSYANSDSYAASGSYAASDSLAASASYAPASASFGSASASYAPASASYVQQAAPVVVQRVQQVQHVAPVVQRIQQNFAVQDNVDPNPLIVRKKPAAPVNYTQQVSVKFLQPPPPQQPGDITIVQQRDVQAAPVAPKLIRQRPPLPVKPAPQIVREAPPAPPAPIAPEHHTIPGKVIPPPPRKVIIERLPQLPQPPQDLIVERWLEYGPRTRRVVFQPAPRLVPAPAPKNVIIQWDSPAVALNRQFRNLGISPASPSQYVAQFGASLVSASQIPSIALGVKPVGAVLAAESSPKPVRLVGDVQALALINRRAPAQLLAAAPVVQRVLQVAAPQVLASYSSAPLASASYAASGSYASSGSYAASNSLSASASYAPASASYAASGSLSW